MLQGEVVVKWSYQQSSKIAAAREQEYSRPYVRFRLEILWGKNFWVNCFSTNRYLKFRKGYVSSPLFSLLKIQ